jgi:hypothetical protein
MRWIWFCELNVALPIFVDGMMAGLWNAVLSNKVVRYQKPKLQKGLKVSFRKSLRLVAGGGFETAASRVFKHLAETRGCVKARKEAVGNAYRSLIVPPKTSRNG